MSSKRPAPTKRERARNEQALKELLKVPGNDRCADCNAQNPGWASWSIGVFLCTRCASIHRKLGTHISKVKSLSLDNWESDQVDVIRLIGNVKANAVWNPDPSKHPIPLNTDESDSVMERYIRNKYEYKLFRRDRAQKEQESIKESFKKESSGAGISFGNSKPASRPNGSSGSSGSSSGISIASNHSSSSYTRPIPPQPPARSVSASFHKANGSRSSSPGSSKIGQVLGVEPVHQNPQYVSPPQSVRSTSFSSPYVDNTVTGGLEDMIKQIRDMGFTDDRKTLDVLKGTGGNVQAAIEILVNIDGRGAAGRNNSVPGLQSTRTGASVSSNPFDELDRKEKEQQQQQLLQQQQQLIQQQQQQQQQQQHYFQQNHLQFRQASVGGLDSSNPYGNVISTGITTTSPDSLFHNQNLFPHRTGPEQLMGAHNPFASASLLQPATPPIPVQYQSQQQQQQQQQLVQQQQVENNVYTNGIFTNSQSLQSPLQTQLTSSNPYSSATAASAQASPITGGYNPFLQAPQPTGASLNGLTPPINQHQPQPPQLQHSLTFPGPQITQFGMDGVGMGMGGIPQSSQPFGIAPPQQQQFFNQNLAMPQQLQPQPTGRLGKSGILSLYSQPHLAPQQPTITQQQQMEQQQQAQQQQQFQHQQQGQTNPASTGNVPGSNNPFLMSNVAGAGAGAAASATSGAGGNAAAGRAMGHMTQQSVDFSNWQSQSGRHSPDAFASLSFRQ